jgi:hypothetical protein
MLNRSAALLAGLLLTFAMLVAGCGSDENESGSSGAQANATETATQDADADADADKGEDADADKGEDGDSEEEREKEAEEAKGAAEKSEGPFGKTVRYLAVTDGDAEQLPAKRDDASDILVENGYKLLSKDQEEGAEAEAHLSGKHTVDIQVIALCEGKLRIRYTVS